MLITSGGGTYIVSWGVIFEVLITSRGGIFTVSYGSKGDLRLFWRGIFGMRGEGEQQPDISGGARLLDDWTLIDISGGGISSSLWCIRCVTSTGLDLNAT